MSLEERIERVERQNRRMRAALVVVGSSLGLTVAMGALQEKDFISISGPNGAQRIRLEVVPTGPRVLLFDLQGTPRMQIGTRDVGGGGQPFVEFYGPSPGPGLPGPLIKNID